MEKLKGGVPATWQRTGNSHGTVFECPRLGQLPRSVDARAPYLQIVVASISVVNDEIVAHFRVPRRLQRRRRKSNKRVHSVIARGTPTGTSPPRSRSLQPKVRDACRKGWESCPLGKAQSSLARGTASLRQRHRCPSLEAQRSHVTSQRVEAGKVTGVEWQQGVPSVPGS